MLTTRSTRPVTVFGLLLLVLAAVPARAGHWVLTTTGSGQAMVGSGGLLETFKAPSPSTNTVTIAQLYAGAQIGPGFSSPPETLTASGNLSVTVTGKWTTDSNSDNTTPPGVWLQVATTAPQNGPSIGTSAPSPSPKFVQGSGSSGSFTISLTLSAKASGTQR